MLWELKDNWILKEYPAEGFSIDSIWNSNAICKWKTSVPADVHTVLIRNGAIGNPVIGKNDVKTLWIEDRVWVYHTEFGITREECNESVELQFDGLDTYADILVNREKIASFSNMLIPHTIDITQKVNAGINELDIVFSPVKQKTRKKLPNGFWTNYSTERAYARKAGFNFGWDWTPRLITVGIWRPVYLRIYAYAYIKSVRATTEFIADDYKKAEINIICDIKHSDDNISTAYQIKDGNRLISRGITTEKRQKIAINDPKLWWVTGQGEPHLYTLEVQIINGKGNIIDSKSCRFGIRIISIDTGTKDNPKFIFVLNGRRIFAKGANWIPISNRIADVSDDWYRKVLSRAKNANMNMLSVWGGGIYERPVFYDFCDENGILVWQYFMFACGEYPDFDNAFISSVQEEVISAVDYLSGHPCIALWVGNVENDHLCDKIGLNRRMYGEKLFSEMIPSWLKAEDPTALYMKSSPIGGSYPNSMEEGDRHNWDVWFNDIPYEEYTHDKGKFVSEFGIHAAPVKQTIEKYTGIKSPETDSFAFRYFNKDVDPERLDYYFRTYTGMPETLDQYIDYSMLIQADALEMACGNYVHNFPSCGGALIWQLNDCCGVQSWSMVDCDNIPKASWYRAKEFFSPLSLYLERKDDNTTIIWAINTTGMDKSAKINIEVGDFIGNRVYKQTFDVTVPANNSVKVKEIAVGGRYYPNVIIGNRPRFYYLSAHIEGHIRAVNRYFAPYKKLAFPMADIEEVVSEDSITLKTDNLAFFVHAVGDLDGLDLEDNYFDLLPSTEKTITYCSTGTSDYKARNIRWVCLNKG